MGEVAERRGDGDEAEESKTVEERPPVPLEVADPAQWPDDPLGGKFLDPSGR